MANKKISALPAMTALTGSELLTGDQSAINANATPAQIATYIQGLGRTFAAGTGLPYILARSFVLASHTGDTSETTLATITVPAGAMGANGILRITTQWSHTSSGNNKTLFVRFSGAAGTAYLNNNVTTTASTRDQRLISNRNATNSQVGTNLGAVSTGGWGSNANAVVTSAVDTTAATTIVIRCQLASSGETITLEGYLVELLYGA